MPKGGVLSDDKDLALVVEGNGGGVRISRCFCTMWAYLQREGSSG